jgi:hypothetical protein
MSNTVTESPVERDSGSAKPISSDDKDDTVKGKQKASDEPKSTDDAVHIPPTPVRPSANTRSRFKPNYPEPHLKSLSDATFQIKKENCTVLGPAQFPTTRLRRTVDRDADTRNRRFHALVLAKEVLGRLSIDPKPSPLNLEATFSREAKTLDHVTSGVFMYIPSLYAEMIHLDDEAYDLLYFDLEKRLRQAVPSLQEQKLDIPEIPRWGYEQYHGMVYKPNDFEILAVRYREEVENFLTHLSKVHRFEPGEPLSPMQSQFGRKEDEFHTPMSGEITTGTRKNLTQSRLSPVEETQETI